MLGALRTSPNLVHAELAGGIGLGGIGLTVEVGVDAGLGVVGTWLSFKTPKQVYDLPFT